MMNTTLNLQFTTTPYLLFLAMVWITAIHTSEAKSMLRLVQKMDKDAAFVMPGARGSTNAGGTRGKRRRVEASPTSDQTGWIIWEKEGVGTTDNDNKAGGSIKAAGTARATMEEGQRERYEAATAVTRSSNAIDEGTLRRCRMMMFAANNDRSNQRLDQADYVRFVNRMSHNKYNSQLDFADLPQSLKDNFVMHNMPDGGSGSEFVDVSGAYPLDSATQTQFINLKQFCIDTRNAIASVDSNPEPLRTAPPTMPPVTITTPAPTPTATNSNVGTTNMPPAPNSWTETIEIHSSFVYSSSRQYNDRIAREELNKAYPGFIAYAFNAQFLTKDLMQGAEVALIQSNEIAGRNIQRVDPCPANINQTYPYCFVAYGSYNLLAKGQQVLYNETYIAYTAETQSLIKDGIMQRYYENFVISNTTVARIHIESDYKLVRQPIQSYTAPPTQSPVPQQNNKEGPLSMSDIIILIALAFIVAGAIAFHFYSERKKRIERVKKSNQEEERKNNRKGKRGNNNNDDTTKTEHDDDNTNSNEAKSKKKSNETKSKKKSKK